MEAGYLQLHPTRGLVITPRLRPPDLPKSHAYTLKPGHPTPGLHNLLRLPIASDDGTGILTRFPSTTLFSLALGADSPCVDERCAGNLGLTASGPFTRFIATHVSIRTSDTSRKPLDSPSQAYRTLSYHARAPFNSLTLTPIKTSIVRRRFGFGRASRLTLRTAKLAYTKLSQVN